MMNLSINTFYLFIAWVLVVTGHWPISSSFLENSSGPPAGSIFAQSTSIDSPTPTHTSTPTITPSITPTTTLEPLPPITLIFPASTRTTLPIITPKPANVTHTPLPTGDNYFSSISPRMKALVIVLVILWIFLAGFLVIYIHQFK
jgi:hypothetical protein